LTFKFESLADHCFIALHQQVIEKTIKNGDVITNSEFIPQNEHLQQPDKDVFIKGKDQHYHAIVNFGRYSRATS